jgi:hypothetical protein
MYVGGRMAELGIERITWYYRRGGGCVQENVYVIRVTGKRNVLTVSIWIWLKRLIAVLMD